MRTSVRTDEAVAAMTLMGDAQLRAALDRGDIVLDPRPSEIRAASIDLRMGPEAFLGTSAEVIDMEKQRLLTIPPGELALVSILEKMQVGNRFAAQIGLRSSLTRRGLALLAGPQIDPGFRGRLHVAFVNLSPVEISISYQEQLITLIFHDLGQDVERPYGTVQGDDYQEQDRITGSEIDDIRQHRGYAMSEVIREMSSLSANVGELRTSVDTYVKTADHLMKRTDLYMSLFVGATVALVLTVIGYLISQAIH
jgi:dCTP deaminase